MDIVWVKCNTEISNTSKYLQEIKIGIIRLWITPIFLDITIVAICYEQSVVSVVWSA